MLDFVPRSFTTIRLDKFAVMIGESNEGALKGISDVRMLFLTFYQLLASSVGPSMRAASS